jgi:myb proto-oncogene protein
MAKDMKNKSLRQWTETEDKILLSLTNPNQRNKWLDISKALGNKRPYECLLRYRSINPEIRKGPWTPSEDSTLLEAFKLYGRKWNRLAKVLRTRNAKQIRERYTNYLDPTIKQGNFTVEEDLLIFDLHRVYGNRWAKIHEYLPTRSADMIKNRFKSSICRKAKQLMVLRPLYREVSFSFNLI